MEKLIVFFYLFYSSFFVTLGMQTEDSQKNTSQEVKFPVKQNELELTKRITEDLATVETKSNKIWNNYKNDVFSNDRIFDKFLMEVFIGKYKAGACFNTPLLKYRTNLAEFYIDESINQLKYLNTENKSILSQKVFLIYIAARQTDPFQFDVSAQGKKLWGICQQLFSLSYNETLEQDKFTQWTKERLKTLKSPINYIYAVQMNKAYDYSKKHCPLLLDYLWRFFYNNRMVKNIWRKK